MFDPQIAGESLDAGPLVANITAGPVVEGGAGRFGQHLPAVPGPIAPSSAAEALELLQSPLTGADGLTFQ